MKIVGFNASPRKNGNSRLAIEKILNYGKENNAEVELIDLNEMNITPCQSCNYCKTHAGLCVLDDDMQDIRKKIIECDAFVLAAPIYFSQMNAQASTFINRLYAFFQTEMIQKQGESYVVTVTNIYDYDIKDSEKLKNIKSAVIITQGMSDETEYGNYLNSGIFDQINLLFDLKDVIVLPDMNVPGIIEERQDDLEKIEKLAEKIIN